MISLFTGKELLIFRGIIEIVEWRRRRRGGTVDKEDKIEIFGNFNNAPMSTVTNDVRDGNSSKTNVNRDKTSHLCQNPLKNHSKTN